MLKPITFVMAYFNSMRKSEDGNAAEYGLIIALVAVVIITGLGILAAALNGMFTTVGTKLGYTAP